MFPGNGHQSYNQGSYPNQYGNQYGNQYENNQYGNNQYGNQQYGNQYGNQPYGNTQYENRGQYENQDFRPPPGPPSLNSPQFQQQQFRYQQQQQQQQQQHYERPSAPPPNLSYDSSGHYNEQAPSGPPPTAPQSFGGNSNMSFQYSNCSGRKKALLIGINYFGSKNELRGCINDVKNMSRFLHDFYGYLYDDMVILTDDQREMARVPTRDNIIRAMQWLVSGAQPNDSYFFHILSHGGLVPDQNGDEESGFDLCVYPVDFERSGPIIDDEMHDIMVKPLPPGCRLMALFDCCHLGTALDLPFVYSTKGVVKEPNLWKDAGAGALKAFMNYETGNISGALSSLTGVVKKVSKFGNGASRDDVIRSKMSPADVISLLGCKDDQTSADAQEAGANTGAMSWAFISVLSQNRNQLYLSLLNGMRNLLAAKYSQKPQLSASHPQDMNLQFFM